MARGTGHVYTGVQRPKGVDVGAGREAPPPHEMTKHEFRNSAADQKRAPKGVVGGGWGADTRTQTPQNKPCDELVNFRCASRGENFKKNFWGPLCGPLYAPSTVLRLPFSEQLCGNFAIRHSSSQPSRASHPQPQSHQNNYVNIMSSPGAHGSTCDVSEHVHTHPVAQLLPGVMQWYALEGKYEGN